VMLEGLKLNCNNHDNADADADNLESVPNGAAGLNLLGNLCRKANRRAQAIEYFELSLKLDPMMWTSFEALCEMGVNVNASAIFGVDIDWNLYENAMLMRSEALYPNADSPEEQSSFAAHHDHYHHHQPSFTGQNSTFTSPQNLTNFESSSAASPSVLGPAVTGGGGRGNNANSTSVMMGMMCNPSPIPYATPGDTATTGAAAPASFGMYHNGVGGGGADEESKSSGGVALFQTPNLTPIQTRAQQREREREEQERMQTATVSTMTSRQRIIQRHHSRHRERESDVNMMSNSAIRAAGGGGADLRSGSVPKSASSSSSITPLQRARKVVSRLYYCTSPEFQPPAYPQHPSSAASLSFSSSNNNKQRKVLAFTPADEQMDDSDKTAAADKNKNRIHTPTPEAGSRGDHHHHHHHVHFQDDAETKVDGNGGDSSSHAAAGDDNCAVNHVLQLLCTLGDAYRNLCQFRCKEALIIFRQLPLLQYKTGWVQHQVGKAHFEMADYPNAKKAFEMMQSLEPHRVRGLELLSTTLWHLKQEVELCYLAQKVTDFDRFAPESWCVVGNCFSLQKEHEAALQFFRRSIQLDPNFTYSHTLSGHEYASNEDYDKAIACFRKAIHSDERHYYAWYGLGAIYYRQEKYDLAEYHFRRALSINTQSSVLHCNLGMLQHANNKPFEALATLERAFQLEPSNPQARFQRAKIWISMERYEDALSELERVRDNVPRESSVQYIMGNVCKKLGRTEQAMRCYMTALDLDPKDSNLIKAAIDKLDEPDIDEEVALGGF